MRAVIKETCTLTVEPGSIVEISEEQFSALKGIAEAEGKAKNEPAEPAEKPKKGKKKDA